MIVLIAFVITTFFSIEFIKNLCFFDYNDINFSAQQSLLIFENNNVIESMKFAFFSENKFYDGKESSLTKY